MTSLIIYFLFFKSVFSVNDMESNTIYCHWNFGGFVLFTADKINILFNHPVRELAFFPAFIQMLNSKDFLSCENTLILTVSVSVQYIMSLRNS